MDSLSLLGPTDQQTNMILNLIYTCAYACEYLESCWSVGPLVLNYSIMYISLLKSHRLYANIKRNPLSGYLAIFVEFLCTSEHVNR